jgi:hypothetical protein
MVSLTQSNELLLKGIHNQQPEPYSLPEGHRKTTPTRVNQRFPAGSFSLPL